MTKKQMAAPIDVSGTNGTTPRPKAGDQSSLSKGKKKKGKEERERGRNEGPNWRRKNHPKIEAYRGPQALVPTLVRGHRSPPRISRLRACMAIICLTDDVSRRVNKINSIIVIINNIILSLLFIIMCYTLIFSSLIIIYSSLLQLIYSLNN